MNSGDTVREDRAIGDAPISAVGTDGTAPGHPDRIVFEGDLHRMNWLRPDFPYAQVRQSTPLHGSPRGVRLVPEVTTERSGEEKRTRVRLTNPSDRHVFTSLADVAITLPLQDRYDDATICGTQRCNVHLFCAGTSSYVFARRMGGAAPHLGLVLTAGELGGYSIERDTALRSNDRGCFLLHPSAMELAPGASTEIAWTIFPCKDPADFTDQALARIPFIDAQWDRCMLFTGEQAELRVRTSVLGDVVVEAERSPREVAPPDVTLLEVEAPAATRTSDRGRIREARASFSADVPGEYEILVRVGEEFVRTRLLVKEAVDVLLERRCRFIAEHQQYTSEVDAPLDGALLAYDNEEEHPFYDAIDDYNAGRERVGMGVLIADYLRAVRERAMRPSDPGLPALLRRSLERYVTFVRRELVDPGTGYVFNDVGRDRSWNRLYNYAWVARLLLSMYRLDGDPSDVRLAHRVLRRFYAEGGTEFYPIQLPILEACAALDDAGLGEESAGLRSLFVEHARTIAARGTDYPVSEVNFEQSIVAPAADILLQTHLLTGDRALLDAAHPQVHVLEQFQGVQADHHLFEVAIRHWDGYWFGKREQFGDTLPHYWRGLTGEVFTLYARATGEREYEHRAQNALRAVLPLIHDDGRASAAHVYPLTVNGRLAACDDPLANDQDWALVFALRRGIG